MTKTSTSVFSCPESCRLVQGSAGPRAEYPSEQLPERGNTNRRSRVRPITRSGHVSVR